MANPRKLFWGGFIGAIAVVAVVGGFLYFRQDSPMKELAKIFTDWAAVEGKITNFTAVFPAEPQYATQDIPFGDSGEIAKQEIFALEVDKYTAFFIASTKYPVEIAVEEENLRFSLDGMLQTIPEGQIVYSNFVVPFLGKNYLEFEIYGPTTDIYFKGRLYAHGDTLYQLNTVYQKALYDDDVFTYFVNSFSIK